jgi:ribosomal protein S3AE
MKLLSFSSELVLQHFSSKKLNQSQQYNIVIHSTTSVKTTVTYIDSKDNLEVILTSVNTSQIQQLIKQAVKEMISSQILQKMSKATIQAMMKSIIQSVINQKLLELNRRKKQKNNRIENNYNTARVMNQETVDERKENERTKI